jgi:hypothetical protein
MTVTVLVIGAASGIPTPHDGRYVVEWNAHVHYGTLALSSTDDRSKAKRFPSPADVLRQYTTVSREQPRRPDGKLNRPLMAVTIEIDRG